MIRRILNIISFISIFTAFWLIILIGYWKLHNYKLIEYKNAPFPVLNPIVKGGERLEYIVDYCKYTDESPRVTKYFVDGVILEVNTVDGIYEKGCHQTKMDIYIPRSIAPSNYAVKIIAVFHPNPLREIKYVTKTINFTVVK